MWFATIFILMSNLFISQSKPLEKESLTSSEKVFDGVLDKTVSCMEGGLKPYLSLLNDEDQEHWKAIGREGIRSYVDHIQDYLKNRDGALYSGRYTSEEEEESRDDLDSSEEYIEFIAGPLREYDAEIIVEEPELTSEIVEIENLRRK